MRIDDLKIVNLESQDQVDRLKQILGDIVGLEFMRVDLEERVIEFGFVEDLDDLTLTDIQCRLRDEGFEAGEIVEGQTCTLRLRGR